ncbi:MAG TPA: CHASE2 domain-containing protein, partial [Myxococcaceae bacterium]|nr:CHASE2 domain-containing protein [Myxococcaceae bacterium]
MFNLASHSSRRRFFRKLGFALSLAVLVGSLLGAFVFFRVPRAELLEQPPHERSWLLRLRLGFESWEAFFYDARARALGRASQRSDVPVVVAVDEEVELQARQADLPALAAQPWSRAVVGSLAHRMAEEGASVVMLDLDLSGPSPVSCGPAPEENDDLLLRAQLDRRPGTSVLPFGWEAQRGRWAGRAPTPYLLPLNRFRSAAEAGDALRSVLALRRPAFLVPEGTQVEVLAGVSSPEEGRSLASALGAGPASAIRELGAEARA